jgi:hypothetical protein
MWALGVKDNMLNLMILKLYLRPLAVLLIGVIIWVFLGVFIPAQMSGVVALSALVAGAIKLSSLVLLGSVLIATLLALYQIYILWQWERGATNCCFNCGGIVSQKYGRYGPYLHCLACGKNKSN